MKRIAVALSTLAVLLVAAPSHADLSEKKLRKLWGKYITEPGGDLAKPKAACVCRPGSPNPVNLRLGYIRGFKGIDGHWYAACWIPEIVNGEVVSENGCGGEFEILSK
jgi:hypothetical protein